MGRQTRAAALLERAGIQLEERFWGTEYRVYKPDGGEKELWPDDIRGFEIIGASGGDAEGVREVQYQHDATGTIITFDNGDNEGKGTYEYQALDQKKSGRFRGVDDIVKVLAKVPAEIAKAESDFAKRLPKPKGWERYGDAVTGIEYSYKLSNDTRLEVHVDDIEVIFQDGAAFYDAGIRDDGGYEAFFRNRTNGELRSLKELERLLDRLAKDATE